MLPSKCAQRGRISLAGSRDVCFHNLQGDEIADWLEVALISRIGESSNHKLTKIIILSGLKLSGKGLNDRIVGYVVRNPLPRKVKT